MDKWIPGQRITSCRECPHLFKLDDDIPLCGYDANNLKLTWNQNTVRDDCPLEDYKEPIPTSTDYTSVDWETFEPIANPYCVSCRAKIAREIKEELENGLLDVDIKEQSMALRLSGNKSVAWWQSYWQKKLEGK